MVFSEQPPLQPLHQPSRRRRSREKITLTATDEFWHSPIQDQPAAIDAKVGTASSTAAAANGNCSDARAAPQDEPCGSSSEMVIPPAHPQLLSDDPGSLEDLKGRDHTLDVIGSNNSSHCSDRDSSSEKSQGERSWLMEFVRLIDSVEPEREDSGVPDGASLDPDECSSFDVDDGGPPGRERAGVPDGLSLDPDECSSSGDDVAAVRVDRPARKRKGVSFNPSVVVQPIPHSSSLSPAQRRRMFSTTLEVRRNKARNKKEFRYDGWDWEKATEEMGMDVEFGTGELIHPAHREPY